MVIKNEPPGNGRRFYLISENDGGTVDVYLNPVVNQRLTEDGFPDYDINVIVVRGIEPYENLENDIRERYYDWCQAGELINM